MSDADIFTSWAQKYRALGYWPRPIKPGSKACFLEKWQRPDPEIAPAALNGWLTAFANFGIGLLMGSPFPDGTRLGAIDVDRNEYVHVTRALLRDPPCGRIGSKGAVFFVRVSADLGNPKFKVRGEVRRNWGNVVECLFTRALCVIPPTIHPSTNAPYRWVGTALHEVDFRDLPIIGA